MRHLHITLLGDFTVLHRRTPLSFPFLKTRALLAYLLSNANVAVAREKLATLLFPDYPDRQARKNLNLTLTRLRQSLMPVQAEMIRPLLATTYETVQLHGNLTEYWVDVWEFNRLLEQCKAHPHQRLERCGQCLRRLKQVTELYRGEFLAGLSVADSLEFQEWRLWQVEEYERQVLQALAMLGNQELAASNFAEAQKYAQRQIELIPWEEQAHRQLMRAFASQGRRTAALAQYGMLCRTLAEEMKAEPETETVALYEAIKDDKVTRWQEPALSRLKGDKLTLPGNHPVTLSPSDVPIAHLVTLSTLPKAGTPFFGREKLLAELSTLLLDPVNRLVTLVGSGGVGKTRLSIALGERLEPQFANGVWFVAFNEIQTAEPAALAQAIGLALGNTFPPGQHVVASLLAYLRPRQLLLIMDNFEHLLDGRTSC